MPSRPQLSCLTLLAAAGLSPGCHATGDKGAPEDSGPPAMGNVLILLTDDIGIDKTAVYGEHPDPASTPNIDALAAEGVLFRNAYAMPTCSPTRASLLTGRYPTRHGIGRWMYTPDETYALPSHELTIPAMLQLSPRPWSTAAIGKWHLTGFATDDPAGHPLASGFQHFAGSLANPLDAVQSGNTPRSYTNWEKGTDGEVAWTTAYMTTDTIDDAIAMIGRLEEPWLLYVAPNAAHTPLHRPPEALLDAPLPEDATDVELHKAMIQVLDDGIGRLMAAFTPELRARTTVIYASDNGTANEVDVIEAPWDPARGKQTVYEGGVRVPLIVTGPLVTSPGTECDALVSVVDILPTVAEIAQIDPDMLVVQSGDAAGQQIALDGSSLAPYLADPDAPSRREVAFAEQFYPNGADVERSWRDRMVRDADWKLIQFQWVASSGQTSTELRLFRFEPDAIDEGEDLLSAGALDDEAQEAYDRLTGALDMMDSTLVYGHARRAP